MTNKLAKCLLPRDNIGKINDALLAQYLSTVQVSCSNPRDFYGHDLVEEALGRIRFQRPISVTLGPIILALCNLGVKIPTRPINFMKRFNISSEQPQKRKDYAVYEVERSALNLLAAQCLLDDTKNYDR